MSLPEIKAQKERAIKKQEKNILTSQKLSNKKRQEKSDSPLKKKSAALLQKITKFLTLSKNMMEIKKLTGKRKKSNARDGFHAQKNV